VFILHFLNNNFFFEQNLRQQFLYAHNIKMKTMKILYVLPFVTLLVFLKIASKTRQNFIIATELYGKAKHISNMLNEKKPSQITEDLDGDLFVYVFSTDGTLIHIDTKENEVSDDGSTPEPNEKLIYNKLELNDTIYTHHVVDDQLYILCASKYVSESYIVIAAIAI
jgi:hypothetical protein